MFIDCCDGSDEFDGSIICHNTCVMGGNVAYNTINYGSTTADLGSVDVKVTGKGVISEDSTQKLQGIILCMTALVQNENFTNCMFDIL